MATRKAKTVPFIITLEANNTEFVAKDVTILDALRQLNGLFGSDRKVVSVPKTKAVIVARRGDLKALQILSPFQMRRFFNNDLTKAIYAKRLEASLK